jgi:hypothetical protein
MDNGEYVIFNSPEGGGGETSSSYVEIKRNPENGLLPGKQCRDRGSQDEEKHTAFSLSCPLFINGAGSEKSFAPGCPVGEGLFYFKEDFSL